MNPTETVDATTVHMAFPLNTLTSAEKEIAGFISSDVIMNNQIQGGLGMIDRMLAENGALAELRHAMLIGGGGCGKTTLLRILRARYPLQPPDNEFQLGHYRYCPMLTLSLPSRITPKGMAIQALRALGDHTNLHGTCNELTDRLCGYIQDCGTQIVCIDETQHLLALGQNPEERASSRLREARNWIKSLINGTTASFIVMGVPETYALIEGDEQLGRRFTHLYTLDPFNSPSTNNTDLVDFVDTLLINLAARQFFSDAELLSDRPADAMRVFAATGGVPSRLKDLVIAAALLAHRDQSSTISMKHFTSGFETLHRSRIQMRLSMKNSRRGSQLLRALDEKNLNPFAANEDVIRHLIMQWAA